MTPQFAKRYWTEVAVLAGIATAGLLVICWLGEKKLYVVFGNPYLLVPIAALILVVAAYQAHAAVAKQYEAAIIKTKMDAATEIKATQQAASAQILVMTNERNAARKQAEVWKASLQEKSKGFPTLVAAIQEYEKLADQDSISFLRTKRHPAIRASEIVAEYSRRRREAERNMRVTKAIIDYYESMAPFLCDLKNDVYEDDKDAFSYDYTDEEKEDPVIRFVSKEEYRRLGSKQRNQLALDRYWQRPKSKVHIGRIYERFIGYCYESKGWNVEYTGIFKGYEDLGRDLICRKENRAIIIQCKFWSQFRTIYEKHIFQFFGTVFQFKDETELDSVQGYFYTTTQVSDLARRFARELGIVLKEGFAFDQQYPCIKCNINLATKERIYHLPFDQQYDNTKITRDGEFYCRTVAEAEDRGFRRAMRWRGQRDG